MPRQRRHYYANRHNRQSATWDQLEPLETPVLSLRQAQEKRLELVQELLWLVIEDGADLAGTQRRALRQITQRLADFRLQGRW